MCFKKAKLNSHRPQEQLFCGYAVCGSTICTHTKTSCMPVISIS